jgi:hypothetical protein
MGRRPTRHVEHGGGPANPQFQAAAIGRLFGRLNPETDPSEIDVSSYLDPTLHLDENIEVFERAYPMFRWKAEN